MAEYPTLTCSKRTETGSNAANRMRRQGKLPATVYGHGDAVSLVLEEREFSAMMHASHSGSQLVKLSIDGKDGGLALVKKLQRDPLKKTPLHLDLQRVSLKEKLHVSVAVVLEGEPIGAKAGGMLELALHALNLSCAASSVPDKLTYDVSGMEIGDTLEARAFELPKGCELLDKPEEVVARIRPPRVAEGATPEEAAAPAAAPAPAAEEEASE